VAPRGIRSGRGTDVPQQGFHCIVDFEDVSFDACIDCASTLGRCQLTASLLRGMADQARDRNADLERAPSPVSPLSVTALVGCVRQTYLKATEPYYQRPDQQYWAYRGTLGHQLVERGAGPGIVAEQRFERDLRLPSGQVVTITGQPDEIDAARSLLIDYKTTDRPPRLPSELHIAQLNIYRWLVAPVHQIDRLGIVYLTMKGVKKASVPIWPDGQVERYLADRAGPLAEAYAGGPWPDLTEDRWLCKFCPVAVACELGPAASPAEDESEPAGPPVLAGTQ
jgi:CRISPR/Cas system-associated exonuclease Cas4 (RecB family)